MLNIEDWWNWPLEYGAVKHRFEFFKSKSIFSINLNFYRFNKMAWTKSICLQIKNDSYSFLSYRYWWTDLSTTVNFTNDLRTRFFVQNQIEQLFFRFIWLSKFLAPKYRRKRGRKMLMKLTPVAVPIKVFLFFFSVEASSFYNQWIFSLCNKCNSLPAKNGKNLLSEEKKLLRIGYWLFQV